MIEAANFTRGASSAVGSRAAAYLELARPGIAALVLMATLLGFALAPSVESGLSRLVLLLNTLLGTAMIATGANAINQWMEAEFDRRMVRTVNRPIPSGRLSRREALIFGLLIGGGGVCLLGLTVNYLTGVLGAVTLATYVLVYTPLKRKGWQSVFVGAVPGALPPVIGWAAADGAIAPQAWLLFGIVYSWQLPHFAAIAWLHRDDYRRAGFPMLSVIDASGTRIGRHMVGFCVVLLCVSLLPALQGMAGVTYGVGAAALGVAYLGCAIMFVTRKSTAAARFNLLASVVYLPALLGLMILVHLSRPSSSAVGDAASAPLPVVGQVPDFSLTERNNETVTRDDLRGFVWVADFIFTSCAGPCPELTLRMRSLQESLRGEYTNVKLVTFTLDASYDTPKVLRRYAERNHADRDLWWFLTGDDESAIRTLVTDGFLQTVVPASEDNPIIHSTYFVLVDRAGLIRGFYDGLDAASKPRILGDIETLLREPHD